MLEQILMIEKARENCRADSRIIAAIQYGSFVQGEGDEYSDIEFVLFIDDESIDSFDKKEWVEKINPAALFFADDIGHYTTIFQNLVRGEFHFIPVSHMEIVRTWKGNAWFPSLEKAILVDRHGELSKLLQPLTGSAPERNLPEMVQSLIPNFINWMLFGSNTLARGEYARSLELLNSTHRYLLKFLRLSEGKTDHWPTPSRCLEKDIDKHSYERYQRCTAGLQPDQLRQAYLESWSWGVEMMQKAANIHDILLPDHLISDITQRQLSYFGKREEI
ncbi:MAG: Lnu(F)/Lnu(G) family lincosamide nucleotidyltransferase [Chloroflexi bacterium]|nr:MAG: Lnu(F)/Lnu(G) family lincosamide nucleotidyltransferase [Chloroflexota bacterium]